MMFVEYRRRRVAFGFCIFVLLVEYSEGRRSFPLCGSFFSV